jgi:hypothetical protein
MLKILTKHKSNFDVKLTSKTLSNKYMNKFSFVNKNNQNSDCLINSGISKKKLADVNMKMNNK